MCGARCSNRLGVGSELCNEPCVHGCTYCCHVLCFLKKPLSDDPFEIPAMDADRFVVKVLLSRQVPCWLLRVFNVLLSIAV